MMRNLTQLDSTTYKVLHVGAPNVGNRSRFDELVDGIFERRWFTNGGQLVQELERRLSEFLHVRHCILVCNATVGMQIACHALELSGEVIVPAFTFVATAHAVQWERLTPVFCDVDPVTHCLDSDQLEELITDRTSAIVGVHVWGHPCETEKIDRLADRFGLKVIYDAAHAFGCRHRNRMIGNFGDCEVFSFHATKFFNTFEGGAITTNNDELAEKLRLMRNFGFGGMDKVIHLGTNGKMSEIHAAMGLVNLDSLQEFLSANYRNYEHYRSRLSNIQGLRFFDYDETEGTNWQYIVIEIEAERFGRTRDEVFETLLAQGIRARRYFFPGCHRMEPYATLYQCQQEHLPATDRLCQRVLCLPNGTSIDSCDVSRICDNLINA